MSAPSARLPAQCLDWMIDSCRHWQMAPNRVDDLLQRYADGQPVTLTWPQYRGLIATVETLWGTEELHHAGEMSWQTGLLADWLSLAKASVTAAQAFTGAFGPGGICVNPFPLETEVIDADRRITLVCRFLAEPCPQFCELLRGQMQALLDHFQQPDVTVDYTRAGDQHTFSAAIQAAGLSSQFKQQVSRIRTARQLLRRSMNRLSGVQGNRPETPDLDRAAVEATVPSLELPDWLEQLLTLSGEAVVVYSPDRRITWTTPGFGQLFGYTPSQLAGTRLQALVPESGLNHAFYTHIDEPSPAFTGPSGALIEATGVHADRTLLPLAVRTSELKLGTDTLNCAVMTNNSPSRKQDFRIRDLENQLAAAQRLATLGQLTSEVAHDFNNLLVAIAEQARAAQDGSPGDTQLDEIVRHTELGTRLTRQLLSYGHDDSLRDERLHVTSLLLNISALVTRLMPENIRVSVSSASGDHCIMGNRTALEQVLLNLAVNARDAMPGGGSLDIHASEVGGEVMIEVRDTGTGMSDAVRSKIFDAAYTTKPKGKGTGLGLAVVAGHVRQMGGKIDVQTRPGAGTRFVISLPSVAEREDQPGDDAGPDPLSQGEEGTL